MNEASFYDVSKVAWQKRKISGIITKTVVY